MNILNLLMPIIGADVYAVLTVIIGAGAIGALGFFAIKNLIYAIQGKPITRWLFRRRTKGEQNLFLRDKEPIPTPTPVEEVVEENKFWPRTLKRIRVTAKMRGGKWNQGEFKDADDKLSMFKKLNTFLSENLNDDNVTSLEFTFADPIGRNANNFLEFNIRRGAKRPKSAREKRSKEIISLITDIENYVLENNGEFTEKASKEFEARAKQLNISTRKVRISTEEAAEDATFIENITTIQNNSTTKSYKEQNYTVTDKKVVLSIVEEEKTK